MNFKIGNVSITIKGIDWTKKQAGLLVVIPRDNKVIIIDVDINKSIDQQVKVSVELGDGIPF